MPNFREDYASDWRMKVFDFIGHVIFGIVIWALFGQHSPWVILLQWVPDIFMLPRWVYGMFSSKYMRPSNPIVQAHRFLHGIGGLVIGLCLLVVFPLLSLNIIAHIIWDLYTHIELRKHPRASEIL